MKKEEPKKECKGSFKDCFNPLNECVCDTTKQETLEEAAENFSENHSIYDSAKDDTEYGFINGAKWQAERMYSEEEVLNILYKRESELNTYNSIFDYQDGKEWFEQFKKK